MLSPELHKEYSFNCLTDEEFQLLREQHQDGDVFCCECDECGTFTLSDDDNRRCDCGNRRCYFQYENGSFYVAVD